MFETTNEVLDEHETLLQNIPAFVDAVTRAKTGTAAIREKTGEQVPTGDAAEKAAVKQELEVAMLHVADQLSALSAKTQDHLLGAKVEISKSAADRLGDSEIVVFAKGVAGAAADNAVVLDADYKITTADLTALNDAITKFEGMKTSPRDANVKRRVATMSLAEAITFERGIYRNELDKMMTRFKTTEPEFYKAYFAARVIVDRAATHAKP